MTEDVSGRRPVLLQHNMVTITGTVIYISFLLSEKYSSRYSAQDMSRHACI